MRRLLILLLALAQPCGIAIAATDPGVERTFRRAEAALMGEPEQALSLVREGQRALAAQAVSRDRDLAQAEGLWLEAEALARLGDLKAANVKVKNGLAITGRLDSRSKLHANLLITHGAIAVDTGQVRQALESFEAALTIFRERKLARNQALALQAIANIYSNAGDQTRVLRYLEQASETFSGDPALASANYNALGTAHKELGQFAQAEAEYRRALVLNREMGSALLQARTLTNIASTQVAAGRLAEAEATANAGLALAGEEGAREWAPFLWGVKAQIAHARGDNEQARIGLDKTFAGEDLDTTDFFFRDFHATAAEVYDAVGQETLALAHIKALKRLDDEAREIRSSTNMALASARFDYSNQELRISRLKAGQLERDVEIARANARMQWIVVAGLLVLLTAVSIGFIAVRRNRDQIRRINAALSKALKAKSEFLATTSHEIRTPLNGILGMTQVLLANRGIDAGTRDRIEVVNSAGQTMKAIVDDILDMARIESGRIELDEGGFSLVQALHDASTLWRAEAERKGLALEADWSAAPRSIVGDERKLRQVVFNLLSNAVKFTEQGRVGLDAAMVDDRLRITVSDSGIGIPGDQLSAIFEPFHQVDGGTTRRYSGTGLGLSICRNLIEAMGGTLTAESVLGRGSRFIIEMPCSVVECAGEAADGGERSVLLIEPNPLFRSISTSMLQDRADHVQGVGSIEEALALPPTPLFSAVVVEPDEGGEAAIASLRQRWPDAQVIALIAEAGAACPAGFDRAAVKSMPPVTLLTEIDVIFGTETENAVLAVA